MYKIGEFSKITNLTVKALRYYDEEEILKPSCRADNDYRLYADEDFEKAQVIVFLRGLDFSIAEIKEILANYNQKEDLHYYLLEKRALISQHIETQKRLMKKISQHLLPGIKEQSMMNYEIEIKEFEAVNVASIRFKGAYTDVGKHFRTIFKSVKDKAHGAPFNCYYDDEYQEVADMELCVPIRGTVTGKEIVLKTMPSMKALCTTHKGSYESLNFAYKALLDYAEENGIECKLPSREIYHKGPGMIFKGNPNNYLTEIAIPTEIY